MVNSVYYDGEATAAYIDIKYANESINDLIYEKVETSLKAEKKGVESWRIEGYKSSMDSLIKLEQERIRGAEETIKAIHDTITPRFMGWKVVHSFRCKNDDGVIQLNKLGYFINPDFSKILEKIDSKNLEEDIEIHETISRIINPNDIPIVEESDVPIDGE